MMLAPEKGSTDAGLKDMFTSKDWMGQYRASHIDIDYQNQSFSSNSSEGEESHGSPVTAAPSPTVAPAPEIPRSADINTLLANPPRTESTTTATAATKSDEIKEALKAAGVGIGFGTLPSSQFAAPTDFMSEYNAMFGATPSTTEELTKQAKIPSTVPSSVPPSFDLNALLKGSMDMAADGKKSLPPSIDILKHLVKQSVDVPSIASAGVAVPAATVLPVAGPPSPAEKKQPKKKKKSRRNRDPAVKEYVEPTDIDVLLGRGGRSNHHAGNKRYRDEVHNLQKWYKASAKPEKTDLSQCLVNYIHSYGGRFLKLDPTNQRWFIVTNIVARRKASQALREHMTMEERAAMKAQKTTKDD